MIKIMHIISDTNIGGAGNLLLNYLSACNGDDFTQCVVLPSDAMLKPRIQALTDKVTIVETSALRDKSLDFRAISELRRIIRQQRPDIVHTHGALSGRIAARQCGCKIVFTRHSAFPPSPRTTRGLGKALFKCLNEHYAHAIIAVNPVCADALTACGIRREIIHTVYNGVYPIAPKSDAEKAAMRKACGIEDGDFVISMPARIEPYKGQLTLIEAAAELARRGLFPKIIIAGTGGMEQQARQRVEQLNLTETVRFPGFIDDVPALLSVSHVQANASTVEATSLSLLEGMSIGIPSIVSNTSGNPYVISHGENGLLFESENPTALADAIARCMTDQDLLNQLGEGALRTYSERFTVETPVRAVEDIYRQLYSKRKGN